MPGQSYNYSIHCMFLMTRDLSNSFLLHLGGIELGLKVSEELVVRLRDNAI